MKKYRRVHSIFELKIGDTIRILKKPETWNDALGGENPLYKSIEYPYEITITDMQDRSIWRPALRCARYGWSAHYTILNGCEVLIDETDDISEPIVTFPFTLYSKNEKWYIEN